MMPQTSFVRPPRIAAWLVNLFTPLAQADAISGDLQEEFSDVASKSGIASARRWYWRQCLKTIVDLFRGAFSAAPWSTAAIVVGGMLLAGFIPALTYRALLVRDIENGVSVQKYVHLLGTWFPAMILAVEIIEMTVVGCIVGIAAKGTEIATTIALTLTRVAFFGVVMLWMLETGRAWATPTHGILLGIVGLSLYLFEKSIMIVVGGLIVRTWRNTAARRLSAV